MHLETLDYFISEQGIAKFPIWYTGISILEPIYDDLDNYTSMLRTTRWLDYESRKNIRLFIREYLELFIIITFTKSANEIFSEWINSIQQYCFQGGYGYAISYPNAPHHWVIKPEFYEQVSNIPNYVKLAACVSNQYINITEVADWEKWSG